MTKFGAVIVILLLLQRNSNYKPGLNHFGIYLNTYILQVLTNLYLIHEFQSEIKLKHHLSTKENFYKSYVLQSIVKTSDVRTF